MEHPINVYVYVCGSMYVKFVNRQQLGHLKIFLMLSLSRFHYHCNNFSSSKPFSTWIELQLFEISVDDIDSHKAGAYDFRDDWAPAKSKTVRYQSKRLVIVLCTHEKKCNEKNLINTYKVTKINEMNNI